MTSNVNARILVDMALDFRVNSELCPSLPRIWTYMMCCLSYRPHTIVIGQIPYPDSLIPELGSVFSQVGRSANTPTATVFGLNFDQSTRAMSMMRNSWALLPRGYVFVNADYLPSRLGGGNAGIE